MPAGFAREAPVCDAAAEVDWRLLLGIRRDAVVLDLGADAGARALALGRWTGHVLHVDASDRGTGAARRHPQLSPTVSRVRVDELQLPFRPAQFDWVFVDSCGFGASAGLCNTCETLKPGGHLALFVANRWSLRRLAAALHMPWARPRGAGSSRGHPFLMSLGHGRRLLEQAGLLPVASYALLPHRAAMRAILSVEPPCPAAAEDYVINMAWQRANPGAALTRRALALLVRTGLMRRLYPDYLLVGRKP
jgi:SAM-dependent methyltransferase